MKKELNPHTYAQTQSHTAVVDFPASKYVLTFLLSYLFSEENKNEKCY